MLSLGYPKIDYRRASLSEPELLLKNPGFCIKAGYLQEVFALSRKGLLLYLFFATALGLGIIFMRADAYWNFSDGVYLYSAREVLHGGLLYSDIAAAQPPIIYLFAAGALFLDDSIWSVRLALGLVQVVTGLGVYLALRRLTENDKVALLGGVCALLTPRALHDFANLLPELLTAPLLLYAALLATKEKGSAWAGVLAAGAVLVKVAYIAPALALLWAARAPRRYFAGLVCAGLGLLVLFYLFYGDLFLRGIFLAQANSGFSDLDLLLGKILRLLWSVLFFVPGICALLLLGKSRDPALVRSLLAGALGSCFVFISLLKHGTDVNFVAVAEPFLLILALAGAFFLLEKQGLLWAKALVFLSLALLFLQSFSLLQNPESPRFFSPPTMGASGQDLSSAEIKRRVVRAQRCPENLSYSGDPYLAFLAKRSMPAHQGDVFILQQGDVFARLRQQAEADRPRCP